MDGLLINAYLRQDTLRGAPQIGRYRWAGAILLLRRFRWYRDKSGRRKRELSLGGFYVMPIPLSIHNLPIARDRERGRRDHAVPLPFAFAAFDHNGFGEVLRIADLESVTGLVRLLVCFQESILGIVGHQQVGFLGLSRHERVIVLIDA